MLDGRSLASGFAEPATDWLLYPVGVLMYVSSDPSGLARFGLPSPTARPGWGAIRRLYR